MRLKDQLIATRKVVRNAEYSDQVTHWMNDPDLPFLICMFDMGSLIFREMGVSSIRILGYNPSQMIGRAIHHFMDANDFSRSMEEVRENSKSGNPVRGFVNTYHCGKDHPKKYQNILWFSGSDIAVKHALCIGVPVDDNNQYIR